MDCLIELSSSGQYILFRPFKPSGSEAELLRRWATVADLARRHGRFRVLVDHSESPPPPRVDMISAALNNPEWREDERWRVAILSAQMPDVATRATLEATAEFVGAIHHQAAVFQDRNEAEAWLGRDGD